MAFSMIRRRLLLSRVAVSAVCVASFARRETDACAPVIRKLGLKID
jgi:hypothetical protein